VEVTCPACSNRTHRGPIGQPQEKASSSDGGEQQVEAQIMEGPECVEGVYQAISIPDQQALRGQEAKM